MKETDCQKALEISKKLAVDAGRKIMEIYQDEKHFNIEYKADKSPLTIADKLSNQIIVEGLRKAFPSCAVLSEEEKDDRDRLRREFCFIVDPLDGTKEFLKRNGQFTINIALAYKHRSIMGVIYVPVSGDLYYAWKGYGSWLRSCEGKVSRLHVSAATAPEEIRLVVSSSHGCRQTDKLIEKKQFRELIRIGSSLKGCLVAKGDAEIYYRYNPTMEWDTAAMQCIAEEAGAVFRQMDDSEMLYNRENVCNEKGFYIINDWKNRI